jgi:hypothetical protein
MEGKRFGAWRSGGFLAQMLIVSTKLQPCNNLTDNYLAPTSSQTPDISRPSVLLIAEMLSYG